MVKEGLTARQAQLMKYIKFYVQKNGHTPSYREMVAELNLRSTSGVHRIVHCLVDRGYVQMTPSKSRSIVVL